MGSEFLESLAGFDDEALRRSENVGGNIFLQNPRSSF